MKLSCSAVALILLLAAAAAPARADWPANGRVVCAATGSQVSPVALADGVGGVFVAWEDTRSAYTDIWMQRLTRAGAPYPGWPEGGIPVCTAIFSQIGPRLCLDGAGGVYVAWTDQTGGLAQSDVYMQRVTAQGAIAPGWPADTSRGVALGAVTRKQLTPVMAADGSGGVFVAWTDFRDGASIASVSVSHVLADGSLAGGWAANGTEFYFDGWNQSQPAIASDGAGGCMLVFTDGRDFGQGGATGYDLYMLRLGSDGLIPPGFSPAGNAVAVERNSQTGASLLADGNGGVFMVWQDYRSGLDPDVYATRIDGTGLVHTGWSVYPSGMALTTATGAQENSIVVPDGAGGIFVVWRDGRTSPTYRIYASHATSAATLALGWPTAAQGGLMVCAFAADQQQQDAVTDGAGGVIIAWRDSRNASTDIYATRLTGDGSVAPGWPVDGVDLCNIGGSQAVPALASDGAGGAFVFWNDLRTDTGDLYGTHLTANGDPAPVAGVSPAAGAGFALAITSANPARGSQSFAITLPAPARVSVDVLDLSGRHVRTLLAGETLAAGMRTLSWDGRDDAGRTVAAGLYFVSASAGGERSVVRVARAE